MLKTLKVFSFLVFAVLLNSAMVPAFGQELSRQIEGAYEGVLLPALRDKQALSELSKALKIGTLGDSKGRQGRLFVYPDIVLKRDFSPGAPALFDRDFIKAWQIREYSLNFMILL